MSGAIYGQVLATSLVVALSQDERLGAREIVATLVVTMLVFWLAHAYASALARLASRRGSLWSEMALSLREEWPLAQAGGAAVLALLLAVVGILSRDTAVSVAIVLGILQLAGWGAVVARRADVGLAKTIGGAAVSAAFGLVLVALKAAVH